MDALLNWIWQGCVVAIATAVVLRLMRSWRGETRYRAVWIALASILLLPLVPALWASAVSAVPAPALSTALPARQPLVAIPAAWWTSPLVIVAIWGAWSAVQLMWMALAAVALRRARRACRPAPADLDARLTRWSMVRGHGRPARIALSNDVRAAAVLGGRTPIIALSPILLAHLADDEIDRVVMHEWAHVQRRDDLVHLLQMAVRVVAGWHPAVWWCDRQLNLEREIACDEMAVTLTGSVKAYATCLTKLAALPRTAPTSSLLPVVSVLSPGLRGRIIRILSFDGALSARPRSGVMIATGGALVTTAFVVGGFQAVGAMPLPALATTVMAATEDRRADAAATPAATPTAVVTAPVSAVSDARPAAADARRARRGEERAETDAAPQVPATSSPASDAPATAPMSDVPPAQTANPVVDSSSDAAPVTDAPVQTPQPAGQAPAPAGPEPVRPWTAAAETATQTGVAIGRGSQNAAVATAGFFNRLGRKIGGAF